MTTYTDVAATLRRNIPLRRFFSRDPTLCTSAAGAALTAASFPLHIAAEREYIPQMDIHSPLYIRAIDIGNHVGNLPYSMMGTANVLAVASQSRWLNDFVRTHHNPKRAAQSVGAAIGTATGVVLNILGETKQGLNITATKLHLFEEYPADPIDFAYGTATAAAMGAVFYGVNAPCNTRSPLVPKRFANIASHVGLAAALSPL